MNASEFVRSRPMTTSVGDLIAEAKEFGFTIRPGLVWSVRSSMRKRKQAAKPPAPKVVKRLPRAARGAHIEALFDVLARYVAKHGQGPRTSEMRSALGKNLASSTLTHCLEDLKAARRIAYTKGDYRTIRILAGPSASKTPRGHSKLNGAAPSRALAKVAHVDPSGLEPLVELRDRLQARIEADQKKLHAIDELIVQFQDGEP